MLLQHGPSLGACRRTESRCEPHTRRAGRCARTTHRPARAAASAQPGGSEPQLPPGWGPPPAGSSNGGAAGAPGAAPGGAPAAAPAPSAAAEPPRAESAAAASSAPQHPTDPGKKRVVIIGAGWGGFGAALAAAKAGADVTVLDAAESPGGLSSAFVTPGGCGVAAFGV